MGEPPRFFCGLCEGRCTSKDAHGTNIDWEAPWTEEDEVILEAFRASTEFHQKQTREAENFYKAAKKRLEKWFPS